MTTVSNDDILQRLDESSSPSFPPPPPPLGTELPLAPTTTIIPAAPTLTPLPPAIVTSEAEYRRIDKKLRDDYHETQRKLILAYHNILIQPSIQICVSRLNKQLQDNLQQAKQACNSTFEALQDNVTKLNNLVAINKRRGGGTSKLYLHVKRPVVTKRIRKKRILM